MNFLTKFTKLLKKIKSKDLKSKENEISSLEKAFYSLK